MKEAEFHREAAKGEADEEKGKEGARRHCLRDTGDHWSSGGTPWNWSG